MVNNDKDSGVSSGLRQVFDEVHGNRMPGTFWNWELFKESVWFMPLRLGMETGSARLTVVLNEITDSGPGIGTTNNFKGFVDTEMAGNWMVMSILENTKTESTGIRYIDTIVQTKETLWVLGPRRLFWIRRPI